MLTQIIDRLNQMKLFGMVLGLEEQMSMPKSEELSFENRLSLLVDREFISRQNKRLAKLLKQAHLRFPSACIEDINYRNKRGIDKSIMLSLATCQWVRNKLNIIITGRAGLGKSYIACALAAKAMNDGLSSQYFRAPRLFEKIISSRAEGKYRQFLENLSKTDILLIDDFGISPLNNEERKDLLEIIDDRYDLKSTIITSQYPPKNWPELIGDSTIAEAILDRIIHDSYKINLEGEKSGRKDLGEQKLRKEGFA